MFIKRDITTQLKQGSTWIQILLGPRQCGKSTLFASLSGEESYFQEVTFDDLQLRQLANRDPALFLKQFEPPLVLDEVQYVPNLFPELKRKIDDIKKKNLFGKSCYDFKILFRLTGSNQILMDKNIRESLAGRASYFYLNTLTVHEILNAMPETNINNILFKGGWPELYINSNLSTVDYLNDYIRTYVEKDIILSAGILKISQFHTVLSLLSARTGQLTDFSDIARDSGVSSVTIKEWVSLLERSDIVYLLKPYANNLNKRLIKSPKLYFLDTGLVVRLQGWSDQRPLLNSPQIGFLFETLVFAELIKFIRNYRKGWELFFWRTKESDEIDFIVKISQTQFIAFEVKLAIHNIPDAKPYSSAFLQCFPKETPLNIVTFGGNRLTISSNCTIIPIAQLHDYLCELSTKTENFGT